MILTLTKLLCRLGWHVPSRSSRWLGWCGQDAADIRGHMTLFVRSRSVAWRDVCAEIVNSKTLPFHHLAALHACDFRGMASSEIVHVFTQAVTFSAEVVMDTYDLLLAVLSSPALTSVTRGACLAIAANEYDLRPRCKRRRDGSQGPVSGRGADVWAAIASAAAVIQRVPRAPKTRSERLLWRQVARDRVRRCLLAHVWRIKRIACERLDEPGIGARFLRDHC